MSIPRLGLRWQGKHSRPHLLSASAGSLPAHGSRLQFQFQRLLAQAVTPLLSRLVSPGPASPPRVAPPRPHLQPCVYWSPPCAWAAVTAPGSLC